MEAGVIKQAQRADDVGLDERLGRINRTVHVRLGGEIHDGIDRVLREQLGDEEIVPMSPCTKNVARVAGEVGEVGGVARVGERVEVDEPVQRRALFGQTLPDEIGTDKTAAAGNEEIHDEMIRRLFTQRRRSRSTAAWTSVSLIPVAASLAESMTQLERGVLAAVCMNSPSSLKNSNSWWRRRFS